MSPPQSSHVAVDHLPTCVNYPFGSNSDPRRGTHGSEEPLALSWLGKVLRAENETGGYTLMLAEDY